MKMNISVYLETAGARARDIKNSKTRRMVYIEKQFKTSTIKTLYV